MTAKLLERLESGPVICAEGYLFDSRDVATWTPPPSCPRCSWNIPKWCPSCIASSSTPVPTWWRRSSYYAHREKLRQIGREDALEEMNLTALSLAGEVARETGSLFAGNVCNTNIFVDDIETRRQIEAMFEEQIQWAMTPAWTM